MEKLRSAHEVKVHNGFSVVKGRFSFIPRENADKKEIGKTAYPIKRDFTKSAREDGNYDMIQPVIISDSEFLGVGDWELHVGKWLCKRTRNTSCNTDLYKRVIVLTEQLSEETIQLICDGRLKDGEVVLVQVAKTLKLNDRYKYDDEYSIYADKGKRAVLHFEERKYTFEQLLKYQNDKQYNAVDFQSANARVKLEKWFDVHCK